MAPDLVERNARALVREVEVLVRRRLPIEVELTLLQVEWRPHAMREPPEELPLLDHVEVGVDERRRVLRERIGGAGSKRCQRHPRIGRVNPKAFHRPRAA